MTFYPPSVEESASEGQGDSRETSTYYEIIAVEVDGEVEIRRVTLVSPSGSRDLTEEEVEMWISSLMEVRRT